MATLWFWRVEEVDHGPVSFRELVTLVRDGVLSEDNLVRPHYSREWQHAARIVGLFHMAGRGDLLALWEDERRQIENARAKIQVESEKVVPGNDPIRLDDLNEMLNAAEIPSDLNENETAWRIRLRHVESQTSEKAIERRDQLVAVQLKRLKSEAISLAMEKIELRESTPRIPWMLNLLIRFRSGEPLKRGFHLGLSFVVAILTAGGIHSWSVAEFIRFPGHSDGSLVSRNFPFFGECSPVEYTFLLVDATLIAGVIGFGLGRLLVNLTDEV